MIDLSAIKRAAEFAHDESFGAACKVLGREQRVEFMEDDDCIDCRLGGLTSEESKAYHAS